MSLLGWGQGWRLHYCFRCAPLLSLGFAGAEQPGSRLSSRKGITSLLPSPPLACGTIQPCKLQVTSPAPTTAWRFVTGAVSATSSRAEWHLRRHQGRDGFCQAQPHSPGERTKHLARQRRQARSHSWLPVWPCGRGEAQDGWTCSPEV